MDIILNTSWLWTAFAITMIVILGTILSVKSKFWDFFFTFIFPIAVTTPMVFFLNRLDTLSDPTFTMAKLYSVLFSAMLVWFIRHKPKTVWGRRLRVLSFSINILEAVAVELFHGFWLNPLAGLLILVTIPRWKTLEVEKDQVGERKLRWESTLLWVLAYSLWNNAFAMNLFPALWFLNILHVVVGLVIVLRDPRWYAQIRAVSLNITFSVMVAFLPAFDVIMSENDKFGPFGSVENHALFNFIYSIVALVAAIATVVQQIILKKGRVASLLRLEKGKIKFKAG